MQNRSRDAMYVGDIAHAMSQCGAHRMQNRSRDAMYVGNASNKCISINDPGTQSARNRSTV